MNKETRMLLRNTYLLYGRILWITGFVLLIIGSVICWGLGLNEIIKAFMISGLLFIVVGVLYPIIEVLYRDRKLKKG